VLKRFLALAAALCVGLAPTAAPAQYLPLLGAGRGGGVGIVTGDPTGLTITSSIWTSSTDLTPVSQFVDGWTADLTIQGATPAGATAAYTVGTAASPRLSFVDTRPGYTSAAAATTVADTIWATSWLRKTYNNETLPTEAANGGNAKIALSLNDFVYASDSLGAASSVSGLYVSGAVTSRTRSGITVTNNSTRTYPRPIGAWVTPPGERIASGGSQVVEFFGGQSYARGGVPLAAVVITAVDTAGTHTVTKTVSTMTASTRQVATACTGTNGSAVLTNCADTSGFLLGMRLTVPGIPGQPKLLSKTSTSLTLGSAQICATTLNSGNITVNGTPAAGDGLADGGFVGATVSDANLSGGVATITSATVTADVTISASKATAAVVHTGATTVTAAAAHACTFNHVLQGSTGSVTVTAGDPVPVYSATFTQSELTSAGIADGAFHYRVQAYPVVGDVVLDSQTGADGTNCDWFYKNVNGAVCNASSAAWFAVAGTDVSPNLHNLWAYLDSAGAYAPKYAWVSGTAGGASAVQASSADPGSTAYYATISAAVTALKTAYGGTGANGGVVCLLAAGSPYASFAGSLAATVVANKPPLTLTSALSGQACSATGTANVDTANVAIGTNGTVGNRIPAAGMRIRNLTLNATNTVQGSEAAFSNAFNTTWMVFENDILTSAAASAVLNKIGTWWVANSYVDQSAGDGRFTQPASSTTGAPALLFGNTLVCATFTANKAVVWHYNTLGNIGWGCANNAPTALSTTSTVIQPLSSVIGYDKWMGAMAVIALPNYSNLLMTHTIIELINSGTLPALQLSGDSANLPVANIFRSYTTVAGARTNEDYLEGVPIKGTAVASGGTFAAGTYYTLVTYALVGNPTVETSTDGVQVTAGTFSGTAVVLNGSMTVELPCDPNYVATIYVDSAVTGAGSSGTLGHWATVGGVDAKQLAMCQTVTVTAIGGAHTSLSVAGSTAHNELKTAFFERFNIDNNFNMKSDMFGGTTGQANSVSSGGKVGDWEGRYRVGWRGNVAVTGTVIGTGTGPSNGLGEILATNDTYNVTNTASDISWVKYRSDRSFGSGAGASPTSPGLNLGQGDYHIDTSVTNPVGVVPTGLHAWPYDIEGTARKSGATACGGAYECLLLLAAVRRRRRPKAANDNARREDRLCA
jgi:hypothetical protein